MTDEEWKKAFASFMAPKKSPWPKTPTGSFVCMNEHPDMTLDKMNNLIKTRQIKFAEPDMRVDYTEYHALLCRLTKTLEHLDSVTMELESYKKNRQSIISEKEYYKLRDENDYNKARADQLQQDYSDLIFKTKENLNKNDRLREQAASALSPKMSAGMHFKWNEVLRVANRAFMFFAGVCMETHPRDEQKEYIVVMADLGKAIRKLTGNGGNDGEPI